MNDMLVAYGMGISLSQFPAILALMAFVPEPDAIIYSPHMHNGTVTAEVDTFTLSPLYIMTSTMIALFGVVTHQLREQQVLDNAVEFCEESMTQTGLWDWVLWIDFALVHLIAIMQFMSPVSLHSVILLVLAQTYAICTICRPKVTRFTDSFLMMLYVAAIVITMEGLHHRRGPPVMILGLLVTSDLLLVMGHVYDRSVSMATVGNCRAVFAACEGMLLIAMYYIH
jgi:hypothetical protein